MISLADYPDACTVEEADEGMLFAFRRWIDKEADHVKEWWCVKEDGEIYLRIVGEWKEGCGYGKSFVRNGWEFETKRGTLIRKAHRIKLPKDFIVGMIGTQWVYYNVDWELDDRWSPLEKELYEKYGDMN